MSAPLQVPSLEGGQDGTELAQQILRQERERAQKLLDIAAVMLVAINERGEIRLLNRKGAAILGYKEGELLGKNWFDTCLPEQIREQVREVFNQLLTGEVVPLESYENPILTRSGEERIIAWHNTLLKDGEGHVIGTLSSGEDITDRKRTEEARRASEELYRTLVETSPDAVVLTDLSGKIQMANRQAVSMYGYEHPEQVLGSNVYDHIAIEDRARSIHETRKMLKIGSIRNIEYISLRRDGSRFPVEISAAPILDAKGHPMGFIGVTRDISVRRQAENAIQALIKGTAVVGEAFFRSLVFELAMALQVRYAFIGRLMAFRSNHIQTVALCVGGKIVENIEYDLTGTPCETVVGKTLCFYPRDLQTIFPKDSLLVDMQAQSYLGIPLFNTRREPIGLIAVVDDHPMQESELAKNLLTIFAARAGAELERLQAEENYRNIVENVSEGIFQTTPQGKFITANPALARILGYASPKELMSEVQDIPGQLYVDVHQRQDWQKSLEEKPLLQGLEIELYRKDGTKIWVSENVHAVSNFRGNLLYYEGTLVDISERKRSEALIHNLLEETERRLKYVQALRDIDVAITSSLDLSMTLNILLDQAVSQLNVNAAAVLLLNPYNQTLTYAAGRGFRTTAVQHTRLRLGEGYAGRAAFDRETIRVPDLRSDPDGSSLLSMMEGEDFVTYYGTPLVAKGQVKGVLEIFHRVPLAPNEEWLNFLETLAQQAAIALDNASLFTDLQRSNAELTLAYDATIEGWSRALDLRDRETEGHTERVADMTERLAFMIGVSDADLVHIRRGALLHDIGKMGVPDNILHKNSSLSEAEWAIMRQHPQYAYDLLLPITYLRPALDIPYCHHEKWDGSGYPRGLKGEQIPLAARIFAIADVWDAITSDRPYRPAWTRDAALAHVRSQSGLYFDPRIVDIFLKLMSQETVPVRRR
jgi:PAS domain S-box-containing protein